MRSERVLCSVVLGHGCEAAYGFAPRLRTRCYACGEPVCKPCSTLRHWPHTRAQVRVCYWCSADEDRLGKKKAVA